MDEEMIAFFIVIAIVVVELMLSGSFSRFYFTVGLPIFRRQAGCNPTANRPPSTVQLEASTKGRTVPEMVFRDLGNSEYAFRETAFGGFFKLSYTPMMHGLMRFDREHRRVLVVGFANWFPIAFLGLFASIVSRIPPSETGFVVALTCGLVLFIYAIQARRFSQVAAAAALLWSKAPGHSPASALMVEESASDRPVKAVKTLRKVLVVCAIAVPLIALGLTLIGSFTEEWTCQEEGSDWKCVGGYECNADADRRFNTHRRAVNCKRTDWPMIPLEKLSEFLRGWDSPGQ